MNNSSPRSHEGTKETNIEQAMSNDGVSSVFDIRCSLFDILVVLSSLGPLPGGPATAHLIHSNFYQIHPDFVKRDWQNPCGLQDSFAC